MQQSRKKTVRLLSIFGNEDDAVIVQAIYDAAPTYWESGGGDPRPAGSAAATFRMLPAGRSLDDKHMYLIEAAARPVGFVDVIRGYPIADTAYIGLFIIADTYHRTGLGRAAYAALECEFANWNGIERVRLAVFTANEPALQFWTAMGLQATGERSTRSANGDDGPECLIFEKRIAADHDR